MCKRKKLIELVRLGVGITEAASLCGFSRKTAYKWLARHDTFGGEGLCDRSRARHANERFDDERAEWLLSIRQRFPTWGPRKLLDYAARQRPREDWPCTSTVAALLQRRGMIATRRVPLRRHPPFQYAGPIPSKPNVRWTMDFKGDFRLGDGTLCKPFTLRDAASRMLLDIRVQSRISEQATKNALEKAFVAYGMPEEIQSDNGPPFASIGLARLSHLSAWLMRLDIRPLLSRPAKPQDNGAHERMHRDLKAETTRPPANTIKAQQRRSDRWRQHFNEERPHAALGGDVPAEHFKPSIRKYDRVLPPAEYPQWWETRLISSGGYLYWKGHELFCSHALRGQSIGIEPVDHGLWKLHLANFHIALLDERSAVPQLNAV